MARSAILCIVTAVAVVVFVSGCRVIPSPHGDPASPDPERVHEGPGPAKSAAFKDTRRRTGTGYANVTRPVEPAWAPPASAPGGSGVPAVMATTHAAAGPDLETGVFARPGFDTVRKDGRLWVFPAGSSEYREFLDGNEPAKHVTFVKAGPGGHTLKGPEPDLLIAYLAYREGFVTEVVDGRIWVFRPDSEPLREFREKGEPAKHVTRPSAGPRRTTVKGPDSATVVEYLTAKPGFATRYDEGRLWVFRSPSESLREFDAGVEPVKLVARPAAGPYGMTLKSVDQEIITAYMVAAEGFETEVDDGRIWVFMSGSSEYEEFRAGNEPVKIVIRPAAGPLRMTVKSTDQATISAYLYQVGR